MDFYILHILLKIHSVKLNFLLLFLYFIFYSIIMNQFVLILIAVIAFLYLLKPNENNYQPTQEEIQNPEYIDKTQSLKDYPYPQISREFKKLGNGKLPQPLNNLSELLPSGDKELKITRNIQTSETMNKQRMYLPDYYRKDRLSQNPEGTEELRPFLSNNNESEDAWPDTNISEHPKFYNSDLKDEITNIGSFFDKNNQYNDKTSPKTESITSDSCYTDKFGNYFCEDNTRLQLIPPKLISDPQKCYALNSVGIYKDGSLKNDSNDRVLNGGIFYNGVNASHKNNEYWSQPIQIQSGECAI